MKITSMTFIALILTMKLFAQSEHVFKTLPPGTHQMKKEEFKAISAKNFGTNDLGSYDNFYENNGILVTFKVIQESIILDRTLEIKQRKWKYLYGLDKNKRVISSEILTYGRLKFLVINYEEKGDYKSYFISDYNSKKESLYGQMQYKEQDQQKASKFLKELFSSFSF